MNLIFLCTYHVSFNNVWIVQINTWPQELITQYRLLSAIGLFDVLLVKSSEVQPVFSFTICVFTFVNQFDKEIVNYFLRFESFRRSTNEKTTTVSVHKNIIIFNPRLS